MRISRRLLMIGVAAASVSTALPRVAAAARPTVTVYKSAT